MATHKCSVCKEDQGIAPRYKMGGHGVHFLACERCRKRINYVAAPSFLSGLRGFFGDLWDFIVDVVSAPFRKNSRKASKQAMMSDKDWARVLNIKSRQMPQNRAARIPQMAGRR